MYAKKFMKMNLRFLIKQHCQICHHTSLVHAQAELLIENNLVRLACVP